jgi:hypothetical protein
MERRESVHRRSVSPGGHPIPSLVTEAHRAPLDEASFMRYYRVAMRAASTEGPAPSVKDRVMQKLDGAPNSVLDMVFGNDPLSRMAIALKNQMSKERRMETFPAVSSRILALILLVGSGSLKRWAISLPHDPQHLYYPDAVVLVAAGAPLVDDLTFEADEFMRLLELRLGGMKRDRFTAHV